jgi:hypothetical protein
VTCQHNPNYIWIGCKWISICYGLGFFELDCWIGFFLFVFSLDWCLVSLCFIHWVWFSLVRDKVFWISFFCVVCGAHCRWVWFDWVHDRFDLGLCGLGLCLVRFCLFWSDFLWYKLSSGFLGLTVVGWVWTALWLGWLWLLSVYNRFVFEFIALLLNLFDFSCLVLIGFCFGCVSFDCV